MIRGLVFAAVLVGGTAISGVFCSRARRSRRSCRRLHQHSATLLRAETHLHALIACTLNALSAHSAQTIDHFQTTSHMV